MKSEAALAPYPALARARFAQAVLACIGLFSTMDAGVVTLLLEPMRREFGMTDFQLGLINTTTFYLAYALLCTPMGMLVDRLNRVRMLLIAMLLWCGGLALAGLSDALWLLVAGKVLMGTANAITYPAAISLFSDYFAPDRRSLAIASYGVSQDLGGSGAVLLGGLGYSALVSLAARTPTALLGLTPWRAVFLLFGGVGLMLLPLVLAMREPTRREVVQRDGGSVRELLTYRRFLTPLFLGMMSLSCVSSGVISWLSPALVRLYGQQPGDFARWFSSVTLCAGVLGMLVGGKLADIARRRRGPNAVMIPAAIAAALCAPASFIATTPDVLCFAIAKFGLSLCYAIAIMIPVVVINLRIPNELRGLTMGLYVVLVALANAIGAPLVAFVSTALGGQAMLGWAMAAVGAPSAILAAIFFCVASFAPAHDGATPGAAVAVV